MRYKLKKSHKLLKTYEYNRVYRAKQHYRTEGLLFAFLLSPAKPGPKLGITIKKKWGKAHERNRFKRIVREAYRHIFPSINSQLHLIIQPRDGFKDLSSTDVYKALTTWLGDLNLLT